ncbi:MAG: hypothetical protein ACREEB_02845 [Caulobacteraceae bacterium]
MSGLMNWVGIAAQAPFFAFSVIAIFAWLFVAFQVIGLLRAVAETRPQLKLQPWRQSLGEFKARVETSLTASRRWRRCRQGLRWFFGLGAIGAIAFVAIGFAH